MDYGTDWTIRGSNPGVGCGVHRAPMSTAPGLLPGGGGGKAAEAKNEWSYTSARICLHGLDRNNFTFIFFVMILLMVSLLSEAGYMIIPGC